MARKRNFCGNKKRYVVVIPDPDPEPGDAPSISGGSFSLLGDILGGAYTYEGGELEANLAPVPDEPVITGTLQEDEIITIEFDVENSTGYAIQSADIKIYRASNQLGSGETLSATIGADDIIIVGNHVIAVYALTLAESGFYILVEASVTLDDGFYTTGDSTRSDYTEVVEAAASPLDVFNELRFEFTGGSLTNQADASDATNGIGSPAWVNSVDGDGDVNYLNFVAAESDQLLITKSGSAAYTEPFTILMYVRMKALTTQALISMNASVRIRVDSTGDWQLNATDVGPGAEANADLNWHWIWATFNGANSKFQIDNQTELTLNNGSLADSGSTVRVGSSTSGSHANMKLKKLYMKIGAAITAPEKAAVNAFLGI